MTDDWATNLARDINRRFELRLTSRGLADLARFIRLRAPQENSGPTWGCAGNPTW